MFACQLQSIQQRRQNALRVSALVLLVCSLSTLNACKTYYKRGVDGGALAADQAECQRRSGEAAGEHYQACLRELGWVTSEQPPAAGTRAGPRVDEQSADNTANASSRASGLFEPKISKNVPEPVEVKPAPQLQEATSSTPAADIPQMPKAVGSWFKLGGTPALLKTDQTDCLAESQYSKRSLRWSAQPDFLTCMRVRGWRALVE